MMKDVLTTGTAAVIAGVSPQIVMKWCERNNLPSYRIPGSRDRRILKSDLKKFLKDSGVPVEVISGNEEILSVRKAAKRILFDKDKTAEEKVEQMKKIFL